jgi:hypothetical protein
MAKASPITSRDWGLRLKSGCLGALRALKWSATRSYAAMGRMLLTTMAGLAEFA